MYNEIIPCFNFRCLEWLLNNLMTHQNVELFKELRYLNLKSFIIIQNTVLHLLKYARHFCIKQKYIMKK